MAPFHQQVAFVCVDGEVTHVDIGMVGILNAMKSHGVKTLYSCQGQHNGDEDNHAYVSIRFRTVIRLLVNVCRLYFKKKYSVETTEFIKKFLSEYWQLHLALYKENGTYGLFSQTFDKRDIWLDHKIELSIDNANGVRIVFRWPHEENETMLKLLNETSQILHGL